ncbi:hypothetical protein [Coraliomargarita akajimensis]|uniref:EF-hand domain-containing protein n=1 Tax=Coraliomargarita akajimensis (strain DSM 45221 / IAM 15411 / JCM 23193 / KCTC 12865 / 04OKA010-24) TaxID=583355 RepID=D5EQQ1_CORAD|nr:hypothetical protein [Coraliomargarita akajimensis]ADE55865.1 conserved hypothetical protein [Coraliomargarita akajimensis DSM 45221]
MANLPGHSSTHHWKLRRIGGIFQPQINTVDDLRELENLDPKLWVALSCPVNDLEVDTETLTLIDDDTDGRVRIEEMLRAVRWTLARLVQPESLFTGGPLPLAAIRTDDSEGQALLASAKQILANTGAGDADSITVEQSANTAKIFGQSRYNGDGILSKTSTDSPELEQLITEIIDCLGAEKDRSGEDGIGQAKLDQFFKQLESYDAWWTKGESESDNEVFPLGETTPDAYKSFLAIESKLDDFYARCQLAAFDTRAEEPLNHDVALYKSIADTDLSSSNASVEQLPLAKVSVKTALPLNGGINPEWQARFDALYAQIIQPLKFGTPESLSLSEWHSIKARFASYRTWRNAKPETGVETLGITRARELLQSNLRDQLAAMLQEDRELAPKMKAVDSVEKLARYHRDLIRVLNNFVNFNDFYDEEQAAIFQAGTLYLDGRECRLCLRVNDPAKHAALASLSRAFVAYCQCKRKDSPGKFYIAAVFSAGDSANLIVGRNGIFRDRKGRLWDTTIVRLIENPISIREAFLMPYVRVGRFIGSQLEKWAVSRDKAIQKQLETGVQNVNTESKPAKADKSSLSAAGGVAGMLAAGGIALGAVGAGLASLFETLKSLHWWEIPIVFSAVILMISFPSMVIAWLKIRQRTLAPLLDASGWAVNGRTLIRPGLGRILTKHASLPLGAECHFEEPEGVRKELWIALGLTVVAVAIGWLLFFL